MGQGSDAGLHGAGQRCWPSWARAAMLAFMSQGSVSTHQPRDFRAVARPAMQQIPPPPPRIPAATATSCCCLLAEARKGEHKKGQHKHIYR
eukprot:31115-Chlamydomonas_euryale.AAC.1